MSKILLVESNELFKYLYSINIELYLGIYDIEIVNSARDAIEYLKNNEVDIILSKNTLGTEKTSDILDKFINKNEIKTPFIIIGKRDMFGFGASCIDKSLNIKKILQVMAGLLGITAKYMAEKDVNEYIAVPTNFLYQLNWSETDVFYKENNNYIKFISKENLFSVEDIKKVKDDFVYVYKSDRLKFANHFSKEIIVQLSEDEISTREQVMLAEVLNDELSVRVSKLGLEAQTIEQCKKAQKIITKISTKTKGLGGLINELINNESSYRYRHTQLCSFISLHILKQMDWSNEEQERKMSFVSFFHNITLPKDEYVRITSEDELKRADLTEEEKLLIKNHAQKSAELVLKVPRTPMGVDIIIRQHHGSLIGSGFTDVYSGNISPMAMIFIIAEQFSHIILRKEKFNFDEAIKEIKEKFPTRRFDKIIEAIESCKNSKSKLKKIA